MQFHYKLSNVMLLLIPYEFDTFLDRRPIANWIILAGCVLLTLSMWTGFMPEESVEMLVLHSWSPLGLIGHLFLHSSITHLVGNMIFLWVFGNALCSNTSDKLYTLLFFGAGFIAAAVHLLMDGDPAIGASGAINGIVGMILAVYPLNQVTMLWVFAIRGGTFTIPAWVVILLWFGFDIWGVISGASGIGYWAHIGGFLGGFALGMTLLKLGIIQTTEWDNETLLEIVTARLGKDKAQ